MVIWSFNSLNEKHTSMHACTHAHAYLQMTSCISMARNFLIWSLYFMCLILVTRTPWCSGFKAFQLEGHIYYFQNLSGPQHYKILKFRLYNRYNFSSLSNRARQDSINPLHRPAPVWQSIRMMMKMTMTMTIDDSNLSSFDQYIITGSRFDTQGIFCCKLQFLFSYYYFLNVNTFLEY